MNTVYEAIMKAADQIETQPQLFDFGYCAVPDCGSPGCALGWIGFFAHVGSGADVGYMVANKVLGHNDFCCTFYEEMNALVGDNWSDDPAICAVGLRLYAVKHHAPAPLPFVDLPAIVRAIFESPTDPSSAQIDLGTRVQGQAERVGGHLEVTL